MLCFVLTARLLSGQNNIRDEKLSISQPNIDEDAMVIFENELVYNSNRERSSMVSLTDAQKRPFFHRYCSEFDSDWNMGPVKDFAPELATIVNDGPVTFTPDEMTICFIKMYDADERSVSRNFNSLSGLYFADYDGEKWVNVRPFDYNDPSVNFYSPCFSKDGKKLFFAANFPDSRGGLDIYVSRKVNGQWSKPENLGDVVNTPQNDFYPFSHSSGRLYFCSEGHDNGGGKDIFMTEEFNGKWLPPQKLGSPFNSAADDYAVLIADDFKSGFYVSSKRGGSKDIYRFYSTLPQFENPKHQEKNKFCYLLKENSADTADPTMFDYEWVINDTLTLKGREVKYCFPGPGFYYVRFNVFNKALDSMMYDQANHQLNLNNKVQTYINCPDTAVAGREILFDGRETYLPGIDIDRYCWDFGDGETAEGIEVRHSYQFPGEYKIVLGAVQKVKNRKEEPLKKANFKQIVIIPSN